MNKPITNLREVSELTEYYLRRALVMQMAYLALEGKPSTEDDARRDIKSMAGFIRIQETV